MLIRFLEVGRDQKTWEADIPVVDGLLDAAAMVKSIRQHKALSSRGVDFTDDGLILVGDVRPVGRWEVVKSIATGKEGLDDRS